MFAGLGLKIGAWLAEKAFMKSPFVAFLKAIPKPVWEAIVVVLYVLALLLLHQHYANAAIKAAHDQGYAQALADVQKQAAKLVVPIKQAKADGETKSAAVNKGVEKTYAQDADHITGTADAIRVRYGLQPRSQRGDGDLAGPGVPDVPASASVPAASVSDGRPGQRGLDQQPPAATAVTVELPLGEALDRAESCDLDHAELKAWHKWYDDNKTIYDEWVAKVQAVTAGQVAPTD